MLVLLGERPTRELGLDNLEDSNPKYDTLKDSLATNFYRRDDVSATAYFYLNKPQSNLPNIATVKHRLKSMKVVWDKTKTQY